MISYVLLSSLVLSSVLGATVRKQTCTGYDDQTWFKAQGVNCYTARDYKAGLSTKDYCYDSINYLLQAHVTLADSSAPRKGDSVADPTTTKICGLNNTVISYCYSHCMDKDIENALVVASISLNYDNIWNNALDAMKSLGKEDWPLLMLEPFEAHSVVDFQYYDDMNYCMMDIVYSLPPGNGHLGWPMRSLYITHKTAPTS